MDLKIEHISSPNKSERNGVPVSMLVYHYTGSMNIDGSISWFMKKESQVSAHYLVDYQEITDQTRIVRMVNHAEKAWHAGKSEWEISEALYSAILDYPLIRWPLPKKGDRRLITGVNRCSIGIELVGIAGRPFPEIQMKTAAQLTARLLRGNDLLLKENCVGHEDVAPGRKVDPGELFDWDLLWRLTNEYMEPEITIFGPVAVEAISEPETVIAPADRMGSGKDQKRDQIRSGWRLFLDFLRTLFRR